jgi:hypothetical protein
MSRTTIDVVSSWGADSIVKQTKRRRLISDTCVQKCQKNIASSFMVASHLPDRVHDYNRAQNESLLVLTPHILEQ